MTLEGRSAIVTGSTHGIGKAIAIALAREGAKLVVNGRGLGPNGPATNLDDVNAVVAQIDAEGGRAIGCAGAVNDFDFARKLVETCHKAFGSVDILVNNAGTAGGLSVDTCPPEHWHEVIDANLHGSYNCCHHAVPHMKAQHWGRILNCGTRNINGHGGGSCYPASKGALVSLSAAMARSLGMWGVTTNCYCPEARTRMTDQLGSELFEEMLRSWLERGWFDEAEYEQIRNVHDPAGVAPFVVYLCTEEAAYINGRTFQVEGGRIGLLPETNAIAMLQRDYDRDGPWSVDALRRAVPETFGAWLQNPAPRRPNEEIEELVARINPGFW
jgi:NAD(P)-dependent dehydrogenase (short-subunit alcohol dehydrogenase family)